MLTTEDWAKFTPQPTLLRAQLSSNIQRIIHRCFVRPRATVDLILYCASGEAADRVF
ncbi:hypothetical protein HYDPIDRAFT_119774 [Hydnomerulius pinastri MD-312]|uniref:Uncharacterized protein n=1 Tax=Hydnomerulius pinastri MD-312 TaxID=994086 RepID=A0A0C9VL04_9AGAM|nr:hypothetical protein HYDPIDRAFT_119774 [Hydnomerulius pinastri MD-312]